MWGPMPPPPTRAERFRYDGYTIDPVRGEVECIYSTGGHSFTERYVFGPVGDWDAPAVEAAVRILFLLAGVSYYKTTAAEVIDLGPTPTTAEERAFLATYYVNGLGEFAYRNAIDLQGLQVIGPDAAPAAAPDYAPEPLRPLIPFGGGIDSIVTVAWLSRHAPDAALCVVHPPGERFEAIERSAAVTKLPVTRITREIDPLVRRSDELGFLNGHVPITAVITAAALVAAVLDRRDAVVLSNEWSASVPTLVHEGRPVNHQWSKGMEFEEGFAELVERSLGPALSVFSYLRSRSELWVAMQFSDLPEYHRVFRSCNRAFHQDRTARLGRWCGRCDKCCFIDLILAPFMTAAELSEVFDGHEPLEDLSLENRFYDLLGLDPDDKPFECVGDAGECRAALLHAAIRPDREGSPILESLADCLDHEPGLTSAPEVIDFLWPRGDHHIPERYAPSDLLVRAH
jgi:UDP-N-acetyl-alpha-D-muramoyl-L-alanyl-L-glutamate epimerase